MAGLERIAELNLIGFREQFNQRLQRASNFICFYWYGTDVYFKTASIEKQFFDILEYLKEKYGQTIKDIISNTTTIDLMYIMVTEEQYYKKSYFHRVYLLTVAYILFKEKRLYFSTAERKYAYMAKISEISREVISEITRRNKRDNLINWLGFGAVTCALGYILS
jgi:hypothetical protein